MHFLHISVHSINNIDIQPTLDILSSLTMNAKVLISFWTT